MMIDFNVYYMKENVGHGNARRKGLEKCKCSLVALMDSDDISLPFRFELQLNAFMRDPQLSIVGGQIAEFIGTSDNITGIREVPEQNWDIKNYMKKRCPMNQVTVMFKKDAVEMAGGYIDWYCEEDYYLWSRMALAGCKFYNVPKTLVKVRVGNEMSARRGGIKYFKSETRMQTFLLKNKIIYLPQYICNVLIRLVGEVFIPNTLRAKLFHFFRKQTDYIEDKDFDDSIKMGQYSFTKQPLPFSVSMCVYGGDDPEWFDEALKSVIAQSVKPKEIVLVVDGPVPESIQVVIKKYKAICGA